MVIGAFAPDVAGVTLGCVRVGSECPGAVSSLFLAVWEFPVATEAAFPGSACPVTPGPPSDAGASPSGDLTPVAKVPISRAETVPSPVTLAAGEVR